MYDHVQGIDLRICRGKKGPDDLRMDIRTPGGAWVALPMGLMFLAADFLAENEDALERSFWKMTGRGYFASALARSVKGYGDAERAKLDRQRERRSA